MTTGPSTPPRPAHDDGTPLSIQLFTVEGTGYGPYVALPVSSMWTPYTAHLFTRATAELIVADLHRDECGIRAAFGPDDGSLTFAWTEEFDGVGGTATVVPDVYGRYPIGGLWPWDEWGDHVPHTAGQAAFARGAAEYRQADDAAMLPEPLDALYRRGRQEAQLVARERAEHSGVPVDVDPSRTPLIVRPRPAHASFRPLPPGADQAASRIVPARDVRAGDLVVASFGAFPTPGRTTLGTTWLHRPYTADPRPHNSTCPACSAHRLVELSAPEKTPWGTERDVWTADEPVLVIPSELLPPVPA